MKKIFSLLHDYQKFERLVKNHDGSDILDASKESFLAPTTITPLFCFMQQNKIPRIAVNNTTQEFVNRIINKRETNTTKHFEDLPKTNEEWIKQQPAHKMAEKINHEKYAGYHTVYHICNELISNIYNHTPIEKGYANQGYSFTQEYVNGNRLDICFMDDGLSIPGKFEMNNIEFIDDCDAISKATYGLTTERKSDGSIDNSRGHGLWTTLKLVVERNKGSALIVSRNGLLYIPVKGKWEYQLLKNNDYFKGTLISLRLTPWPVEDYYGAIDIFSGKTEYEYKKIKRIRRPKRVNQN